jgi:hypothetical protein
VATGGRIRALVENVGNALWRRFMEKLLVAAICLLSGVVLTALSHRPARGLAAVVDVTRHDIALWMLL